MSEHVATEAPATEAEFMFFANALRAVAQPSLLLHLSIFFFTICKILFGNGENVTVLFRHTEFEQMMPRVFQMLDSVYVFFLAFNVLI